MFKLLLLSSVMSLNFWVFPNHVEASSSETFFFNEAINLLGQANHNLHQEEQLVAQARRLFQRSYEANEEDTPHALYQLANLSYEQGETQEAIQYLFKSAWQDQPDALNLLTILAEGEMLAQYKLGRIYEKKFKDYEIAESFYKKAGVYSNGKAFYRLSKLYDKGCLSENFIIKLMQWLTGKETSTFYLEKSAAQGYHKAKKELGWMYAKREDDKSSDTLAIQYFHDFLNEPSIQEWLLNKANNENSLAQYILGTIYEKGLGVEISHSKAIDWYTLAAQQEEKEAQYALACLLEEGYGPDPFSTPTERLDTYNKAALYYESAFKQGQDQAEEKLYSLRKKQLALEKFIKESEEAVTHSKNRLFKKLESIIGTSSKYWPQEFYNSAAHLTNLLCLHHPEGTQQMGLYVLRELSGFLPNSRQGRILVESLLELIPSKTFTDLEIEDQCEILEKIAQEIHATVKPCFIYSPNKIPDHLKVSQLAIEDPRIKLFNYFFNKENQSYDPNLYGKAVEALVEMLKQANLPSKDQRLYDPEFGVYGTG